MVTLSAMSLRAVLEMIPKVGKGSVTEGAGRGDGFLIHVEVLK